MRGETSEQYLERLRRFLAPFGEVGRELTGLAERAGASAARGEPTTGFADSFGCNREVTGYMYHSVPAALHAWFSFPRDLPDALRAAIRCGGDADTVAAITGAIVGAGTGKPGIPQAWLDDLWDWPRGVRWIELAAEQAVQASSQQRRGTALFLPPWWLFLRNLGFLLVVLAHGFRRLAPPY
jgi:hypothetical protein